MHIDNDYLIEFNDDRKPLIITFGGINGGICQPLFEFKNFLKKNIDCHVIFIRDTKQSWYHRGIIGFGDSINELKNNIKEIICKINYSKIITIGGSMGGYASLLFGNLLNVNAILAFSAQTFIDEYNRKKYNDNRWDKQIQKIHNDCDNTYYDLSKLNFENINVQIFYGENDKLDKIHCERMKNNKNINVKCYDGKHAVLKKLRDNGILLKIINDLIKE